mgnify:FL=1
MNIKTVLNYTRQNTGKHFLDSGGAYGRVYDTTAELNNICYYDSCGTPCISLTRWLADYAEIHHLHQAFYKWARGNDLPWFEAGQEYMTNKGYQLAARDNTYNNETDFDQCFVYEVWVPEYNSVDDWLYADDAVIFIYAHTGCDVRGGYASPIICTFDCMDYVMPIDWQCNLYSDDLSESQNEQLSVGYSSYPLGQLEELGFEYKKNQASSDMALFVNQESGQEISVSLGYYQ